MKSAAQHRAAAALKHAAEVKARDSEGDAIRGFPGLILRSGLLPTLAFALEKNDQGLPKRDAHARVALAVAQHLSSLHTGENLIGVAVPTAENLFKKLSESDSEHLRRCTTEAIEFLSYLKRFAV